LTEEERSVINRHTLKGSEMVAPLHLVQECVDGIKYHHERYDGKGYPEGLKGDEVPLAAAVVAVADTFDAMTTDRPYRKGLSQETAIVEIKKYSGTQFNPLPAKAMVELYEAGKI